MHWLARRLERWRLVSWNWKLGITMHESWWGVHNASLIQNTATSCHAPHTGSYCAPWIVTLSSLWMGFVILKWNIGENTAISVRLFRKHAPICYLAQNNWYDRGWWNVASWQRQGLLCPSHGFRSSQEYSWRGEFGQFVICQLLLFVSIWSFHFSVCASAAQAEAATAKKKKL